MDKETIDYTIAKLDVALQKIAPTAIDVGQEMVRYTVFSQVVETLVVTVAVILSIICMRAALKKTEDDMASEIVWIIGIIWGFSITIGFFVSLWCSIKAVAYPLMFTIEKLT